jgi:hypothetical protein
MSTEVEAVGAAVTAGLAASVVDGEKPHREAAHGACANCGAQLSGNYCATCGQPAHVHRTLGHMVEEFLHGLLHFDTRAWRTLPMLVFRPGTLTRDYIHGKRARYISPLAIFLLAVFTMFVVFAFAGGGQAGVVEANHSGGGPVVSVSTQTAKAGGDPETVYEAIAKAVRDGDFVVNTGWADFDKKVMHKLENPELAVYKFQNAAYKFAFLLVPISLPFVWLLFFWKRGLTLFDHTVYILYSLSFVSVLFIVISLMANWPPLADFAPLLLLTIPVHAFFQMKGGYDLGWFSALWRTPVLMAFAGIGLLLFLVAILAVGLVG